LTTVIGCLVTRRQVVIATRHGVVRSLASVTARQSPRPTQLQRARPPTYAGFKVPL